MTPFNLAAAILLALFGAALLADQLRLPTMSRDRFRIILALFALVAAEVVVHVPR